MSTKVRNTCGAGTSGNVTPAGSSANSAGTAFDVLVINGSSTPGGASSVVYATTNPPAFSTGGGIDITYTAGSDYLRLPYTGTATGYTTRFPVYLNATVTATLVVGSINGTGAGANLHRVTITTAMKVQSQRGTTSTGASGLSATVLSTNTLYWIEFSFLKESGGGGNGEITWRLFAADGTTQLETKTVTAQATGTADAGYARFGGGQSGLGPTHAYLQNVAIEDQYGSVIGPPANAAPTGSVTANQTKAVSTAYSATATATDPEGLTLTYAWTGIRYTANADPLTITGSLTGAGTATVSYTSASVPAVDILTCTVSDPGGQTLVLTTEVRVVTTSDAKPLRMAGRSTGSWTIIGGSTTEGGALNDASSATRMESPDITGTLASDYWRLEPMGTRTGLRITASAAVLTAGIANNNKIRVHSGGATGSQITERATSALKKVSDNSTSDITTSDLDLYLDLTGPEITALTAADWGYVEVAAVTTT